MGASLTWETTTFRRLECIAENPSDALIAVDERLRRMRRAGWQIPDDASVDLRPSGHGWAARLVLPESHRDGDAWSLQRRIVQRSARPVSGIDLRPHVAIEIAREA